MSIRFAAKGLLIPIKRLPKQLSMSAEMQKSNGEMSKLAKDALSPKS